MLYSKRTRDTYENFEAECPHCSYWNIFNRVVDLEGASNIAFRKVVCLNSLCKCDFAINGDSADVPYAKVFLDAYGLMAVKRYGDAVLNIARAYEMFFAHALFEILVWKPFMANRRRRDVNNFYGAGDVNPVVGQLQATLATWSYWRMRNAFVSVALIGSVDTLAAGNAIVLELLERSKRIDMAGIDALQDGVLQDLLRMLVQSAAPTLRNKVIHKSGYRPTVKEAEQVFEEARHIIWTLASRLDVRFQAVPSL